MKEGYESWGGKVTDNGNRVSDTGKTIVSLRNDFCFWVKTVKGLILSSYMALYLDALGIESMLASTST